MTISNVVESLSQLTEQSEVDQSSHQTESEGTWIWSGANDGYSTSIAALIGSTSTWTITITMWLKIYPSWQSKAKLVNIMPRLDQKGDLDLKWCQWRYFTRIVDLVAICEPNSWKSACGSRFTPIDRAKQNWSVSCQTESEGTWIRGATNRRYLTSI